MCTNSSLQAAYWLTVGFDFIILWFSPLSILVIGLLLCSCLVTCPLSSNLFHMIYLCFTYYLDDLWINECFKTWGPVFQQIFWDRNKTLSSYCFTTSQRLDIFPFTSTITTPYFIFLLLINNDLPDYVWKELEKHVYTYNPSLISRY